MNPASARRGKRGEALERAAASAPGILFERLPEFGRLGEILEQFAADKVDLLIISGGDGTIQAVVTQLAEQKPFKKKPPRLMLLPHGTTNMTAKDLGLGAVPAERVIEAAIRPGFVKRATAVKQRNTVRISGLAQGTQHGFFFGLGAVTRAVVKCQLDVHELGLKGDWATGATLFWGLANALVRPANDDPDRIYQASHMTLTVDGEPFGADQALLFFATTLDRLIMGSRPFWNQTDDGLHITQIGYPLDKILRRLPRVMYGGDRRNLPEEHYLSRSAKKVVLNHDEAVIIDGEIHEPAAGGLTLEPGPGFEFICAV
jgi:diacylglycerol kinase family enzyme